MSGCTMVIDGGTTNLRVTLLDAEGTVLSAVRKEAGVSQTAVDGHNGRLKEALGDLIGGLMAQFHLTAKDIGLCAAYGMITSREGLWEVPHTIAPLDAAQLRGGIFRKCFPEIAPFPIAFIPGVKNSAASVTLDTFAAMDMMRGEETEAIGLWELLRPLSGCIFALPGSHNKFVRMDAKGRILGCMTTLSGEFLSALTHHTILSGAVNHGFSTAENYDRAMALAGYREAEASGLGRAAFAGRILSTLGGLPPDKIASYLLGAVLCADVQALAALGGKDTLLYVAGKEPVKTALCDLVSAAGLFPSHPVAPDICARMGVAGALHIMGETHDGL